MTPTQQPAFAPRTVSLTGCRNAADVIARLEQLCDEIEAETIRAYATSLLEEDIDTDEFQDCVLQFRQSLARFREEHRAETHTAIRGALRAARIAMDVQENEEHE